jgi:hypothetical protein
MFLRSIKGEKIGKKYTFLNIMGYIYENCCP